MIEDREINFYAPTGTMWHQAVSADGTGYRDGFDVWVQLRQGGNRYLKHVYITGSERDEGSGMLRLFRVMQDCWMLGPKGMILVEEGGFLPLNDRR